MIVATLMSAFARQRLASPMRLLLAFTFLCFGVVPVLLSGSLDTLAEMMMRLFGFVFAAGLIGQEVSSGVLTLTFARPVRRAEYVLARWLGAGTLAGACVLLQVLAGCAAVLLRHGTLPPALIIFKLLDGLLAVFGVSAVIVMFSSCVPGLGDLGLFLLATVVSNVLTGVGGVKRIAWVLRAGEEMQHFLDASLDPAPWFRGAGSWFALLSYFSTIAICLVLAIWAVNRKELSYASG